MPPSIYNAHKKNHSTVSKALTQVERAVNDAIRRRDSPAEQALTMTQMLLVAVKAESRLQKLINTPDWLNDGQQNYVKGARSRLEMWQRAIEVGFRSRYNKTRRTIPLEDQLGHDPAARYRTMLQILEDDLREIIETRNKLAHGQWAYGLTEDGQISSDATRRLRTVNTLALRYKDSIAEDLANAVGDLLLPGALFDIRFDEHYRRIKNSHESLGSIDFQAHVETLRRSRANVSVTRTSDPTRSQQDENN